MRDDVQSELTGLWSDMLLNRRESSSAKSSICQSLDRADQTIERPISTRQPDSSRPLMQAPHTGQDVALWRGLCIELSTSSRQTLNLLLMWFQFDRTTRISQSSFSIGEVHVSIFDPGCSSFVNQQDDSVMLELTTEALIEKGIESWCPKCGLKH